MLRIVKFLYLFYLFIYKMDLIQAIVLILIFLLILIIGFLIGKKYSDYLWKEKKVPELREEAIEKSRAVLGGQFSEQLAPYLPDFKYSPTEVRFVGKPIDFIVFKGMDNKDIKEVVFVEVKSGKSDLSTVERILRDAIKDKKVSWEEYRIPEEVTKK